jgi:cytochrome d ubiquinol oxidase subunit II
MILVSVWTPIHDPTIPERWFSAPRVNFIWSFPALGVLSFLMLLRSLSKRSEILPFVSSVLLFISAYLGLLAALYPYAIPPNITVFEAAAQKETLLFTLIGTCIVLPVVLAYIVYSYWVFRGKAASGEVYH